MKHVPWDAEDDDSAPQRLRPEQFQAGIKTVHPYMREPEPAKICLAPSCGGRFTRKVRETKYAFDKRETCGGRCARELQGLRKSKNVDSQRNDKDPVIAWITGDEFSCVNCDYQHEDSEIGGHCGPCTSGQNFKRREKR